MLYLLKIAARNLRRNLLRTAISIAAIAAVVAIVVLFRGLMVGFTEASFRLYIENELGHVRLIDEEYDGREVLLSLDYTVDGVRDKSLAEMTADLEKVEGVEHVLPRLRFGAMASVDDEDDMVTMIGVGIDQEREQDYGALSGDISEGVMPQEPGEILLGTGLAEDLKAGVGRNATLVFSDAFQSLQGRTFTVTGLCETGSPVIDDNFFYLPLEQAQHMLALEGEATELLIFGETADAAPAVEEAVSARLNKWGAEGYLTTAWNRADPFIELFLEFDRLMYIAYVLFIVLGVVVVISTLFMIIRERQTEIGMMTALGLKGRQIMQVFTLEGALMGLIGSFVGVVVGGWVNYQISLNPIELESWAQMVEEMDVMMDPLFYTVHDMENLIFSFLLGTIITSLACLYPARKAAKLNPVDALKKDV